MVKRFLLALFVALSMTIFFPRPAYAAPICTPDVNGACPWYYEWYLFGICYGNGFLCWRTW